MKIFLTGASGFIGSALMTELLKRGHDVTAFSRNALSSSGVAQDRNSWLHGSLDDESTLDRIAAIQPDVCVHSAWITTPGEYLESEENEALVGSSYRFLSSLPQIGTKRIVVIGTCLEKIKGHTSKYAASKSQLRVLLENSLPDDVSFCWARLFYPYGEGEPREKLSSYLADSISRGVCPTLKTPHSTFDYIHVKDVAAALATVSELGSTGLYEIGNGNGTTVLEIASKLATIFDRADFKAEIREQASLNKPSSPKLVADIAALKSLGWSSQISLEEGLRMLAESNTNLS